MKSHHDDDDMTNGDMRCNNVNTNEKLTILHSLCIHHSSSQQNMELCLLIARKWRYSDAIKSSFLHAECSRCFTSYLHDEHVVSPPTLHHASSKSLQFHANSSMNRYMFPSSLLSFCLFLVSISHCWASGVKNQLKIFETRAKHADPNRWMAFFLLDRMPNRKK